LQQDQGLSGNQRLTPSILSFRDATIVYQGDRRGSNMNLTKKILTGVLAFICVVSLGSPVYAGGKKGGNSNHAASSGHVASSAHAAKGEGSKGGSGKGGSKGGKSGGKGGSKDGGGKDEDGRGSGDASDTANKIIDLINSFKH
jgi:hypothetical protein